jgi:hypothetical protein
MREIRLLVTLSLFSFFSACGRQPPLECGSVCTVNDGEGSYRVAKVLVVDDFGVHIRLYKDKWKERPDRVDLRTLSLGSIHDKDGFGMGHLPLTKRSFAAWKPVVVGKQEVTKEELEGYEMWKEGGGGYFGNK